MSTPAATDPQAFQGNRAHQLIVATMFAILLPTVFLALRLLARHVLRIRLYFDDWLIIIAWFFKIGLDISGSLLIKHGMGRHIEIVSIPDLVKFMQIQYTLVVQYSLCIIMIELFVLYQYRRLFPKHHDFKLMTSVLITMMVMWCTSVMSAGIFICTLIRKAWTSCLRYSKCILVSFHYGMQIPNVFLFVILLALFCVPASAISTTYSTSYRTVTSIAAQAMPYPPTPMPTFAQFVFAPTIRHNASNVSSTLCTPVISTTVTSTTTIHANDKQIEALNSMIDTLKDLVASHERMIAGQSPKFDLRNAASRNWWWYGLMCNFFWAYFDKLLVFAFVKLEVKWRKWNVGWENVKTFFGAVFCEFPCMTWDGIWWVLKDVIWAFLRSCCQSIYDAVSAVRAPGAGGGAGGGDGAGDEADAGNV